MLKKEHLKLIEKTGKYWINGLEINVTINDIKSAYGNIRVNIKPVSGNGNVWVNLDSVKLTD